MAHTFTNLLTHAIFSTRDRVPLIIDTVRADLHGYLGGILRELRATPVIIGGTADHAHVLMRMPADLAVADCLRILKTNSSRWVKEKWPRQRAFGWQGGYGAFSVSESSRASAIRYIAEQDRHHRKITFQDEFLSFLKKHGMKFDERYIWK